MKFVSVLSIALLAVLAGCNDPNTGEQAAQPENRSSTPAVVPTPAKPESKTDNGEKPSDVPKVDVSGFGTVRTGMTLPELKKLPETWTLDNSPTDGCNYATNPSHPKLALMVVDNRVVRIDVISPRYETARGARIGMSEAQIKALYPTITVTLHPYTGPKGHYLNYREPNTALGMIFETDGMKVLRFRTGEWDKVQWIEGCL